MSRRTEDPFLAYSFLVELGSIRVGGFSECSGLNASVKTTSVVEGGRNNTTLVFPESTSYGNITLKKGISFSRQLMDWLLDVAEGRFAVNARRNVDTFAIVLQDELGREQQRWELYRVLPVKWSGPDLKANSSEVAFETLELSHEGIS